MIEGVVGESVTGCDSWYTPLEPQAATEAGGTHPTEMHSCARKVLCYFLNEGKLLKINHTFVMTSKIVDLFECSSMCGSRDGTVCDVL